ncbi:MAG TPA: GAF domain-containing protein [Terriglobales bacterium]|nr:GAF domain-containing protein [Terriglobales bacterium]
MATQIPDPSLALSGFTAALLSEREVTPSARLIAAKIAEMVPGIAVAVYSVDDRENPEWTARAILGEIRVPQARIPFDSGTLGELARSREPFACETAALTREDYSHLDVRRTLLSLAYLPLIAQGVLVGAIEIAAFEVTLDEALLASIIELTEPAAAAISSALKYESERNANLRSISRITQLYDIEKVLNSTLEMDELLPIVAAKFAEILQVQAVNLWMVDGDGDLLLSSRSGVDPAVEEGAVQRAQEGVPGEVSESGEPVLIDSPDDPRLEARNAGVEEGGAFSLMAAPLIDRENLVGVAEAINRLDGRPFDEDDLSLLDAICETAAGALHNASLLQAERKVEILETLVTVSHEITSTLNLERMLQTIVNAPQAVIPYERAAIALEQRGRLRLSAVTGLTQVNADSPEIAPLYEILQWAALSEEVVHISQHDEEIDDPREETRAKFRKYFASSGMRGFYAIPLTDDSGRVGILSLESSDPDFLTPAHLEIINVLAGQATVALRNAQIYKEVPFISVLEPVLEKKRKFMAMEKRRRTLFVALAVAVIVALVIIPLPMRLVGDAVVAPLHSAQVQPEVEGVVQNVFVHEGEKVAQGQVLAEITPWNFRSAVAAAQAKYQTALLQMNRALAANDGTEAGIQSVQADYWKAELARATELLNRTQLRSPIAGVVATPHVEDFVGRRLQYGDSFAEVVDTSQAIVDVAVDDTEAPLLRVSQSAAIKLDGFPARTFRGSVLVISPKGATEGEEHVFYARVSVPNPDGVVRAGMEGRGKVRVGWRPAGYVLLRGTFFWAYSKLWNWFGW